MKLLLRFFVFLNVYFHTKCIHGFNLQSKGVNTTISGNGTNATFGVITGYASTNVPAYSNGNDSYISNQSNSLYGVYTGMPWQCVEYARRWLFIRKGCVFDSIDDAAQIWTQLYNVQRVVDKKCFNFKKIPNGSPSPPQNESLLIYNYSGTAVPFGHVAVIVDVLANFIRVAEQNYDSYYWSGNYSRQIEYALINGSYYIQDDYPILGWMPIDDNNQTQPLNQTTINAIIQLNGSSPDFICQSTTVYPQNSTVYPQNSTVYPQNSTIYPQNNTVYPQNSTVYSQNNAVYPRFSISSYLFVFFFYINFSLIFSK